MYGNKNPLQVYLAAENPYYFPESPNFSITKYVHGHSSSMLMSFLKQFCFFSVMRYVLGHCKQTNWFSESIADVENLLIVPFNTLIFLPQPAKKRDKFFRCFEGEQDLNMAVNPSLFERLVYCGLVVLDGRFSNGIPFSGHCK